jgi:hypothetical protein
MSTILNTNSRGLPYDSVPDPDGTSGESTEPDRLSTFDNVLGDIPTNIVTQLWNILFTRTMSTAIYINNLETPDGGTLEVNYPVYIENSDDKDTTFSIEYIFNSTIPVDINMSLELYSINTNTLMSSINDVLSNISSPAIPTLLNIISEQTSPISVDSVIQLQLQQAVNRLLQYKMSNIRSGNLNIPKRAYNTLQPSSMSYTFDNFHQEEDLVYILLCYPTITPDKIGEYLSSHKGINIDDFLQSLANGISIVISGSVSRKQLIRYVKPESK